MLYDSSTAKIDDRGMAYEVAAAAPNEMPEGVLGKDDYKMVKDIEIIPLSKLIGEIHMKGREFEDEAGDASADGEGQKRCFACRPDCRICTASIFVYTRRSQVKRKTIRSTALLIYHCTPLPIAVNNAFTSTSSIKVDRGDVIFEGAQKLSEPLVSDLSLLAHTSNYSAINRICSL